MDRYRIGRVLHFANHPSTFDHPETDRLGETQRETGEELRARTVLRLPGLVHQFPGLRERESRPAAVRARIELEQREEYVRLGL